VDEAAVSDGWLHEIKLDGYRSAARLEAGKVRMLTRSGLDWAARFRPTTTALAGVLEPLHERSVNTAL
jgi:bifunctional non-homologous end joining protein LigD